MPPGLPISSVIKRASSSVRRDLLVGTTQNLAAPAWRVSCPPLLCIAGRIQRGHGVFRPGVGDFTEELLGRRVLHRKQFPSMGLALLAADEELLVDSVDDSLLRTVRAHQAAFPLSISPRHWVGLVKSQRLVIPIASVPNRRG